MSSRLVSFALGACFTSVFVGLLLLLLSKAAIPADPKLVTLPYPSASSPVDRQRSIAYDKAVEASKIEKAKTDAARQPERAPDAEVYRPAAQATAKITTSSVVVETWQPVVKQPTEPWKDRRAKVFTYVLAGSIGGPNYKGTDQRVLTARSRIEVLVHEIKVLPKASDLNALVLENANLFCIPSLAAKRPEDAKFDIVLSDKYRLHILDLVLQRPDLARVTQNVGPMLVAFTRPVGEVERLSREGLQKPGNEVLAIDLSGAEAEAIPVYVAAFKEAVREEGVSKTGSLSSLRANFASAVVRANRAVPLLAEAYASAAKTFAPPLPASGR